MPKQIYKISQYHGGFSDHSDPRDIEDNEQSHITNFKVDHIGKLKLLGSNVQYNSTVATLSNIGSIQPGYGLFFFSSDFKGADGTENDAVGETDYLILFDNSDGKFNLLKMNASDAETGSGAEPITLPGGNNAYPVYHIVDGHLRISDAGFDSSNKPLWYGYLDIDHFDGKGSLEKDFTGWYLSNATPEKPVATGASTATFGKTSSAGLGLETHSVGITGSATIGAANMIDDACSIRVSRYAKGDDITDYMHLDVGPGQAGALVFGVHASNVYSTEAESTSGSSVTLTIDDGSGSAPYDLATLKDWFLGRQVYKSNGDLFGVCTRITGTTTMIFDGGLTTAIAENDRLYVLGRWGRDSDSDVCINTHNDEGGDVNGAPINAIRGSYAVHWNSNENSSSNDFASEPLAVDIRNYHDGTATAKNISSWTTANKSLYLDIYITDTLYDAFEANSAGLEIYVSSKDVTPTGNGQNTNHPYAVYNYEYLKKYITKDKWSTIELIPNEHTVAYSNSNLGIEESAPDDIDSITFNIVGISSLNSAGNYHALNQILFDNFRYGTTKNITPSITNGWGSEGEKWNIWKSFVYENEQESLPKIYTKDGTATASETLVLETSSNRGIYIQFYFHCSTGDHERNLRIKGERFYASRNSETLEDQQLYHIADIDYEKGGKPWNTETYSAWENFIVDQDGSSLSDNAQTPEFYIESPSVATYESINGYRHDGNRVKLIGSENGEGYKTSVVANRQLYIGNVKTTNEQGTLMVEGDSMYKSYVNRFDCIPTSRKIQASVNDGDSIVKLESYADRILQYKKQKMHIINISQDIEFLEETFMHKGVTHPAAVCKTDYGIAWVNKNGCYLYDGKQVIDLLEKRGKQMISESRWNTFTNGSASQEPMIGYIAKKRQIIVSDDIAANGAGNAFLYDMVTGSWIEGGAATFVDENKTNFVNDNNGELIFSDSDGSLLKWSDDSVSTNQANFVSKDIDFGNPAQRKKVYKVYVTYKYTTNHPPIIKYDTNGDTGFDKTFSGSFSTSSEWKTIEFTPSTPSEANNIYSFAIRIYSDSSNATHSTFEINDISIVYRLKSIK